MRRSTIFEFLNRQPDLTGEKVRLRSRRPEDAPDEYRWRVDEELCRLDAATPIALPFNDFRERYALELEYPGLTYTLAIDALEQKHLGNCSLFNFDFLNSVGEIGILIGEKTYWSQGYGTDAVKTFVTHIFETSEINRIILRTLNWNSRAQRCFEKCGFQAFGNLSKGGYDFMLMDIKRRNMLRTISRQI
ncbi:MAG: GNAT family N-acetyltransferase [Dehalococcoidia bacterium]